MTYTIQFHPQIKYEIKDSYNWYESKTIGLGESLLLELEDAFSLFRKLHIFGQRSEIYFQDMSYKDFHFQFITL